jgi:curved DNA-binding protein CbpA
MDNYYELLGITRNATAVEVKAAFQEKMKALEASHIHGDHEKVQEKMLQQAFLTLLDPARRAKYDKEIDSPARRVIVADVAPPKGVSVATMAIVAVLLVATVAAGWYLTRPYAARREAERIHDEAVAKGFKDREVRKK